MCLFCFSQTIFAGVQISENTARLSFTWTMDGLSIVDTGGRPAFVGFKNQNVELGDSGQPIIPAFSFLAGVPPQGKAALQFTPISMRTYSLKNSLRLPKSNSEKRTISRPAFYRCMGLGCPIVYFRSTACEPIHFETVYL